MKTLKLTEVEMNLMLSLLKVNKRDGAYWGNKVQFYARQDRIIEQIEKVLLEKP